VKWTLETTEIGLPVFDRVRGPEAVTDAHGSRTERLSGSMKP
jgi:hypothetical protein